MIDRMYHQNFSEKGLGWITDSRDPRDYQLNDELLDKFKLEQSQKNLQFTIDFVKKLGIYLQHKNKDEIERLVDALVDDNDIEIDNYSIFSIRQFDILRPNNSHPNVKVMKYYLNYFLEYIRLEYIKTKTESLDELTQQIQPLVPQDMVQWLKSDYYDERLKNIVKVFQKHMAIEEDGIIGIDTFKALIHWFEHGLEKQVSYKRAISVAFPAPLSSEVLALILRELLLPKTYEKLKTKFENDFKTRKVYTFKNDSLKDQWCKDPSYQEECERYINRRFDTLADLIAKDYYLYIEPLILVILLLLQTVGTYKNLDTAIEIAMSRFRFIVKFPTRNIDNIIRNDYQAKVSYLKSLVENSDDLIKDLDLVKIIDLQLLGSMQKLRDQVTLDLKEEIDNISWLQKVSYWAIYQFINRISLLYSKDNNDLNSASTNTEEEKDFVCFLGIREKNGKIQVASGIVLEMMISILEVIRAEQPTAGEQELIEGENQLHSLFEAISQGQINVDQLLVFFKAVEERPIETAAKATEGKTAIYSEAWWDKAVIIEKNQLQSLFEIFLKKMEGSLYTDKLLDAIEYKPSVIELVSEGTNSSKDTNPQKSDNQRDELGLELSPIYKVPGGKYLIRNWHKTKKNYSGPRNYFAQLPDAVDLSYWCSPVSDQGSLNSCTAHAGVALLEYFARQYANDPESLSTAFLYKVTRNLANRGGDVGASPRETMRAMVSVGIPPARFWAVDDANFDAEPPQSMYALAQNYQALSYFRLDCPGDSNDSLLTRIKIVLAAGFPCMFGFILDRSIYEESNVKRGLIPFKGKKSGGLKQNFLVPSNVSISGHAVVAVGYHNYKRVPWAGRNGASQGAILIRNSWGEDWGIGGYGWLPYDYVRNGLTSDWWSLIKAEWLETGRFGLGGSRCFGGNPDDQLGT